MRGAVKAALVGAVAATFVAPATATPAVADTVTIGVGGRTSWPEVVDAVNYVASTGVPIHVGCNPTDKCITITHYRGAANMAAWTEVFHDNLGTGTVHINDSINQGRDYRMMVAVHEIGHALGLQHNSECGSSMKTPAKLCGHFSTGYSASDVATLRKIWGR